MSLTETRKALALFLEEQLAPVKVWAFMPETLTPPCVAVTAGGNSEAGNWITPGPCFGQITPAFAVLAVVPSSTNEQATAELEALVEKVIEKLEDSDQFTWTSVDEPQMLITQDTVLLTATINVQPIREGEF
jgi:hypothetical protein